MSTTPKGEVESANPVAPVPTYAVPPPREVGELIYVFRRDLARLREDVTKYRRSPATKFYTAGWAALGVGITAGVSLAGYYGSTPRPAGWESAVFLGLLAGGLAAAVTCFVAGWFLGRNDKRLEEDVVNELRRLEYSSPDATAASPTEEQIDEVAPET